MAGAGGLTFCGSCRLEWPRLVTLRCGGSLRPQPASAGLAAPVHLDWAPGRSLAVAELPSPARCVGQISDIQVSGQSEDMTAKEKLLLWSQRMVEGCQGLRCDNFTTSWRDGRLFNAIIHRHKYAARGREGTVGRGRPCSPSAGQLQTSEGEDYGKRHLPLTGTGAPAPARLPGRLQASRPSPTHALPASSWALPEALPASSRPEDSRLLVFTAVSAGPTWTPQKGPVWGRPCGGPRPTGTPPCACAHRRPLELLGAGPNVRSTCRWAAWVGGTGR